MKFTLILVNQSLGHVRVEADRLLILEATEEHQSCQYNRREERCEDTDDQSRCKSTDGAATKAVQAQMR